MENAIIMIGNTGVGKSFVCNKIFEKCGNNRRFKSSSSTVSVTGGLQQEQITYDGKVYSIIDTPGFFDCQENATPADSAQKDGENVCKLVKALEECQSISAIVFIFVERFDQPQRLWYDRIVEIVGPSQAGQIILLRNKENQISEIDSLRNELTIASLIGMAEGTIAYHPFTMFTGRGGAEEVRVLDQQILKFLGAIAQRVPFTLKDLVVPQVCYEKEEVGEEFEKELAKVLEDVGHDVITRKDGSYYETVMVWDPNPMRKAMGFKVPLRQFRERMVEELVHVKKEEITRTVGIFQNIYKVRFDGTKDLEEMRLVRTKVEKY